MRKHMKLYLILYDLKDLRCMTIVQSGYTRAPHLTNQVVQNASMR